MRLENKFYWITFFLWSATHTIQFITIYYRLTSYGNLFHTTQPQRQYFTKNIFPSGIYGQNSFGSTTNMSATLNIEISRIVASLI